MTGWVTTLNYWVNYSVGALVWFVVMLWISHIWHRVCAAMIRGDVFANRLHYVFPARNSAHVVCCMLFLATFSPWVSIPRPPYFFFLASINEVILTLLIFSCLPFEKSPSFCVLMTPQSQLMIFCSIILHTYAYNCPVIMIMAGTWDCYNYYCYTVVELVFCSITSSGNTRELYLHPYRLRCTLI